MQINGMGNGYNHSINHGTHQVTECLHDQDVTPKMKGGAAASVGNTSQMQTTSYAQQEGQPSLSAWLKSTLSDGKKLLLKIWGDSAEGVADATNAGENNSRAEEQVMAQMAEPNEGKSHTVPDLSITLGSQEMAAAASARQPMQESNPYFSTIEDTGREKQSIWEKAKVKFHSIAGQLLGRFSNKNSLQQEKPKEDLRKHSRYREDDLEIDCILTDDSYLMDSYDRKGEYSKLTTKK